MEETGGAFCTGDKVDTDTTGETVAAAVAVVCWDVGHRKLDLLLLQARHALPHPVCLLFNLLSDID